jgi:leucyl aminopeptidase
VVVGIFEGEKPDNSLKALEVWDAVAGVVKRPECTGKAGEVVEAFHRAGSRSKELRVLVVGLGPREAFDTGRLRGVGGAVGRRLAQARETSAEVELAGTLKKAGADAAVAGRAFGEGIGLIGWKYDEFRGKASPAARRISLSLYASGSKFRAGMKQGLQVAESANRTRTLSQTPPNVATPLWIANYARAVAREAGLGFRVLRGRELEKEKLVGLINVGRASRNKPCFIRLEYRPKGKGRGRRPIVLIGKTMTYDSGGLSIKSSATMAGMKRDKDGGCAVLGTMHAVATLIRPPVPVVGLLPTAENFVGNDSYRPDDVIRYRNGVTVEVTNTDAEGRLILADALCWACEKEKPRCIIDLATLTGGVVVALGSTYAGLFCEDEELRQRLNRASASSGELVWRLPLHPDYRDMMKSSIADIVNSSEKKKAHPIQGAAFLSYFVEEGIPWAHLDIAGVHESDADKDPFIKGPTGWGVRLLAAFLSEMRK